MTVDAAGFRAGIRRIWSQAAVFPCTTGFDSWSHRPRSLRFCTRWLWSIQAFCRHEDDYYVFRGGLSAGTTARTAVFSSLRRRSGIERASFQEKVRLLHDEQPVLYAVGGHVLSPQGLKAGLAHMVFHGIIKISRSCAQAQHQAAKSYIKTERDRPGCRGFHGPHSVRVPYESRVQGLSPVAAADGRTRSCHSGTNHEQQVPLSHRSSRICCTEESRR